MSDEVPARAAASLILVRDVLVRDGPALQVLMGERPAAAKAFPGALVFPGGKVERQDADPAWAGLAGEDDEQLALRVAAIRETFEETGVLLARDRDGRLAGTGPELADAQAAVGAGELDFADLLAQRGLTPDLAALVPFARWITPLGQAYRFDTWFFIAAIAEPAVPRPAQEFVSLDWIEVQAITEQARSGARRLLFPTYANLGLLAESPTAQGAVAAARARVIRPVMPEPQQRGGRTVMTIRADAGFTVDQDPLTEAR
jgi:8-oxo-dGTP pyrophosphatase MutT (NUDIX family)